MSDINYNGPPSNVPAAAGQNNAPGTISPALLLPTSYADLGTVQTQLATLKADVAALITTLEAALSNVSVPIVLTDTVTQTAMKKEWPTNELGAPPNYITYAYYKFLITQNTSSAAVLIDAYEKGVQGIGGNNAVDLLPLAGIISQEAGLISDFVTNNLVALNDSSEHRVCENLQNLTAAAITQVQNLQLVFTQQNAASLSPAEVSILSSADAQNTQALFQVNVNKLNGQIAQEVQQIQTNFAAYSANFYNDFLAPALNFRQNVSSQLTPAIYPGTVGNQMSSIINSTDSTLAGLLVDQTQRTNTFDLSMANVLNDIAARDSYTSYIAQLATTGSTVAAGSSSTVITATDSPSAATYFANNTVTATAATPNFYPDHMDLVNLTDPQAHPQYLLTAGGLMTGDISLDTGATIDGIIPHTHAHTGTDGSAQIDGANVLENSLSSTSINTNEIPTGPTNLEIVFAHIQNNGVGSATIIVGLGWDGDPTLSYEIQTAPVSS